MVEGIKWDYYTNVSTILLKKNIISKEDEIILNQMAGFRNRLSHEYLSLDPYVMADIINFRLSDFSKFLTIIKNYCGL